MKMRKEGIFVLVAILAMGISIAGIGIVPVMGHNPAVEPIYSGAAYTPPAIDGVIGEGEWGGANILDYGDGIGNVTVWVMNDGDNLYIAATLKDSTPGGIDIIGFAFDADHDGNLTEGGEDGVGIWLANDSDFGIDGHYNSSFPLCVEKDVIRNIDVYTRYDNGNWTVELSKPLNSGDPQDMSVGPGATIGVFSKVYNDADIGNLSTDGVGTSSAMNNIFSVKSEMELMGISTKVGAWPPGANGNNASTYGDIVTTTEDWEAPEVSNATASPDSIPDDTDNVPLWGENSTLNVTVTDPSGIASVTLNLSSIGGLEAAEMTNIEGTDIWSITTNASDGMTSPFEAGNYTPFQLYVNATDSLGNSNTSAFINLTVLKNGDVSEDGETKLSDAMYIAKWYYNKPGFDVINERVGDVSGDGEVKLSDSMYITKWYYNKPGFEVLK